ncbi:MAG TPA: fimbrial protein [Limnobacter sp.]|nr:fimbrial protein [Limnobacter sp.]
MFKKLVLVTAVCALPAIAQANDTITFTGKVLNQTCKVDVVGHSANPVITMPTVSAKEINDAGNAGKTVFGLLVKECGVPEGSKLPIHVLFKAGEVTAAGNIANSTGTAKNVELELIDTSASNKHVDLSLGESLPFGEANSTTSSIQRNYVVQYISPNKNATPGTVGGALQYSLVYP